MQYLSYFRISQNAICIKNGIPKNRKLQYYSKLILAFKNIGHYNKTILKNQEVLQK
jgi:hypothetical protein